MGNRIETEIANLLHETPQLVKLGITMEFRDTLNRTAVQLEKNLDRKSKTLFLTFLGLSNIRNVHRAVHRKV